MRASPAAPRAAAQPRLAPAAPATPGPACPPAPHTLSHTPARPAPADTHRLPLFLPTCSRDYTAAEKEQGLHKAIMAWASESRSNRGFKEQLARLSAEFPAPGAPAAAAAAAV